MSLKTLFTAVLFFLALKGFSQMTLPTDPEGPCPSGSNLYYFDMDGDGYGNPNMPVCSDYRPSNAVWNKTDCNDNNADLNPMTQWYRDADGDGYGDPDRSTRSCEKPSGYISNATDCDDSNASVNPGASEVNDGKDNNCDGVVDNGAPSIPSIIDVKERCGYAELTRGTPPKGVTWYWQSSSEGTSTLNSKEITIRTVGSEYYLRARRNSNHLWSKAVSATFTIEKSREYFIDQDGDGYGSPNIRGRFECSQPSGYVSNNDDCNDSDANIKPGATEINDGKDNNCDGAVDNGTLPPVPSTGFEYGEDCGSTTITRKVAPPSGITWYWQSSDEGASTDDSSASTTRNSGTSYYLRARDNNTHFWSSALKVDYSIDEPSTWYADWDGDGFGDPSTSKSSCSQPAGYVANSGDACPDGAGTGDGCPEALSTELSNQNYVFTRTYQNPLSSPEEISGPGDVIEEVAYYDGLGRPMQQVGIRAGGKAHPSILSTNSWREGSGSAPFFNRNGAVGENNRVMGTGPFGNQDLLWKCGNDVDNHADGGWNTDFFPVDRNASYRYSVWVKRTGSQDGSTYHGTQNVNNLDGTANGNPYFWSGDMPTVGDWYLLVGVVHPHTYTRGDSGISGVYDQNGNRVKSGRDFKWRSNTVNTRFRSYLYYATQTATRQYFWQPVLQKLDGTESSIGELVSRTDGADLVTHIGYDPYGRQTREYLPAPMQDGNTGTYRSGDMELETASYYRSEFPEDFDGLTNAMANPYSESLLESSPLNRVEKMAAPGRDWRLGGGNEIEMDYSANGSDEVRLYRVSLDAEFEPTLSQNTAWFYESGQLYKTITKDENWTSGRNNTTEEFTDKQGRVVLKRSYADIDLNNDGDTADPDEREVSHDTYYVYDDYGNLTYVIPPKVDTSNGISQAELDGLCYQYRYDQRDRLVEKKIPGKGDANTWEAIVYDQLDRPILTQDPNLQEKGQWLFTKYDAFGRVVYTGLISRNEDNRTILQAEADGFTENYEKKVSPSPLGGITLHYSNRTFPSDHIAEIHTVNYYDTYLSAQAQAGISLPTANSIGEVISTKTKTLPTVSKVRVLGTDHWITTVTGYDEKGRPVWSKTINPYLETTDLVESDLDFTGRVLTSKTTHNKTGQPAITIIDTFTYDDMGRMLEQQQEINSNSPELIGRNTYDELGQLVQKQVGGSAEGIGLQTVAYGYNVRGWLRGINDPDNLGDDLFGFKLNYNGTARGGDPLFNGNIAETEWKTKNDDVPRWYSYGYDALNRITSADAFSSNYDLSGVAYDKNGNITTLSRRGAVNTTASSFGDMDILTYTYDSNGNKLSSVNDAGAANFGFRDGSFLAEQYTYDENGNMISDANKGISAIAYNYLNLPEKLTISGQDIEYTYDATGVKLEKAVSGKITEYAGNFVYEELGGTMNLQFFNHPEGYVSYDGGQFNYIYNYTDHLGSIRLSYNDANGDGYIDASVETIQEKNYYPFGLTHKGYNGGINGLGNDAAKRYLFGGKELQNESISGNSLDWYDFGARNYDAALGRWMNIDPLAEDFYTWSTYNYTYNNPINFVDPTGMGPESADNEYEFVWNKETKQYDQEQVSDLGGNDFDVIHYKGGENDGDIDVAFNPATENSFTPERGGMIGERTSPGEWDVNWRGASGAATAGHYGELLPLPKLAFGKYLGRFLGWGGKKTAQEAVEQGLYTVYQGVEDGVTRYVGITSRGVTVRAAEHKAADAAKAGLNFIRIRGMENLTKTQARIFEQRLINQYGLQKNGGLLLNKINSIAPNRWSQYGIK